MGLCFIVGNENNLIYPRWSRRVKYFSLFLLLTALILVITVNKLPPLTPHHLSSSTLNYTKSPLKSSVLLLGSFIHSIYFTHVFYPFFELVQMISLRLPWFLGQTRMFPLLYCFSMLTVDPKKNLSHVGPSFAFIFFSLSVNHKVGWPRRVTTH